MPVPPTSAVPDVVTTSSFTRDLTSRDLRPGMTMPVHAPLSSLGRVVGAGFARLVPLRPSVDVAAALFPAHRAAAHDGSLVR